MRVTGWVAFLIALLMFSLILSTGCGSKSTEPEGQASGPTGPEPGRTSVQTGPAFETTPPPMEGNLYECGEQGFSFLYDQAYTVQWDGLTGVSVFIENPGEIPYVQIYRGIGEQRDFDIKSYFPFIIEELKAQYGDRVIATRIYEDFSLAGKLFEWAAAVKYRADLGVVDMLILTEVTPDSVVQYISRHYEGRGEATRQALEKVLASYRQEAGFKGRLEDEGQGQGQDLPQQTIRLVPYDGGYFSLMLPEGWQLFTMGDYTGFGFRAWDPMNPDYEIFYYGSLSPLNKSYENKQNWRSYVGFYGIPLAELNADAPVVDMNAASSLFPCFADLQAISIKHGLGLSFPALDNFTPLQLIPVQTVFASISTSEEIVFASLTGPGGGDCRGKFAASLGGTLPFYVGGVDMSPASALNVIGVIAPRETFLKLEDVLTQAVSSLRFTDQYIQDGIAYSRSIGQAAMANNEALWAVFDEYTRQWTAYFRGDTVP